MSKGSCLCGGVRYEASGPFTLVARCHCRECRKASGAEFATNASLPAANMQFIAGENLLAHWESSPGQHRIFCGRCGSPILKRVEANPETVRIRLGCLDDEIDVTPSLHVFVSEKPDWSEIGDALPQFDTIPASPKG
jgi:hypothetical protein